MKVSTRIVLDMKSGEVLEHEFHEYDGPVAQAKGSSTTVTNTPSDEELALQRKQVEIAGKQLEVIQNQIDFQQSAFEDFAPLLEIQTAEAARQAERAKSQEPIFDELLDLELERIRLGGAASPEQLELIGQATDAALAAGEIDIERFQTEATERLGDELSNALGLRASDTPIVQRGQEIAEESVRQQGQLAQTLRGAQATATLNFPLAAGQVASGQAQFQQGLLTASNQFSQQLRDAAFQNRLRLTGTQGGLGVSLAGASRPIAFGGGGTTTQTTSGGGFGLGSLLGGAGGLLTGLGGIGIGF